MAVAETILIAAAPECVWALIDDPEMLPLWMPDVIETVYPDGRPAASLVGTRFVQRVRDKGRVTEYQGVVTGYEPGHYLAIDLTQPMFRISVGYRLSPAPTGTRLDFTGDLSMHNPMMNLMAIAAWPLTSSILKRQIAGLKRVAESLPPAAVTRASLASATVPLAPRAKSRRRAAKRSSN